MKTDEHGRLPRRRDFLALALFGPTFASAATAMAAEPAACELEEDSGRVSMRATLEYMSPSTMAGKTCAGCTFFTKTVETCGQCKLIGGPVSAGAVCGSWAPRKK